MRQIYYSIRTLLRERGTNIIRIISLSLGLTIGILLFSQIAFELSYELASCVLTGQGMSIYYEDKLLSDVNYIYADTCFFQTFGIPVLKGNPKDMIMPGSVFVSEHFARETFGDADPIGKILKADRQNDFTIRGVYKDMPENTVLTHDFVVSIHRDGGYQGGYGWKGNDVFYTFLRLRNAADIDKVNDNIQRVIEKYTPAQYDDWKMNFSVIPLVKYHLISSDVQKRLIIYGFLGFAIFFVAIMNYMLISIATLSRRAKGVGVHKCSGASSGNIFGMFLAETGILVIFSVLLSLLLIVNAHEIIEDLLSVRLSSLFAWETLWVPLLTIVILFLLAGGIPGRLFSRIPVTQVFRRYSDGKTGWKRSLGIKIIEGSTLKKQDDLLVNEELVRLMKWTDGAVGKKLNDIQGTIVGVFRDVRNYSFFSTQAPIVLIGSENANHVFDVRLKEPYDENLKRLNEFADKTFPNVALHFSSVDGMIKDIYKSVYRFRNSVWITSSFILLIVIMGLIGYVNDETQRRSKEIAIRKVNGAEASHILRLLIREILYVSASSILIGTIVSYFVGKAWLDQFAEQIYMNPLLFVGTALFVLLLIVVCVVLKAWHIANENPVKSIKSE